MCRQNVCRIVEEMFILIIMTKNEFEKHDESTENLDFFFEYLCRHDSLFLNFSAIHLFYKMTQKTKIISSQNLLLNSTGDLNSTEQGLKC